MIGSFSAPPANPMGFALTQQFDAAARLSQITSSWNDAQHPATLLTVDPTVGYYPHGALRKMTLGNGITETAAYNNRLQPCRLESNSSGAYLTQCADAVPSGNILDFSYGFNAGTANNGNVASWTAAGAQTFNRTYTYDELNRIKTMSSPGETCAGLSWNYDIWANRTDQNATGGSCTQDHRIITTQNRLNNLSYDAAGSVTSDPATSAAYTYDAENRLISSNSTLGSATYVYDANGRRIRKTVGSTVTDFFYDLSGSVAAERVGAAWTKGYVYLGTQLLAQYDNTVNPATTFFAHRDHLGSTRLLTKLDRSTQECTDYLPMVKDLRRNRSKNSKKRS